MSNKISSALLIEPSGLPALESAHSGELASAASSFVGQMKEEKPVGYALVDGVAVIRVGGPMLPRLTRMHNAAARWLGLEFTGSLDASSAIQEAASNSSVKAIMLDVDSPGGEISGLDELLGAVSRAKKLKPVHAHISGIGASAAYWVASRADMVTASSLSRVGSIGAMVHIVTSARAFEESGLKSYAFRSGNLKAPGAPGLDLSEDEESAIQARVDSLGALFLADVESSRDLPERSMDKIRSGDVFLAQESMGLGLIDGVLSSDEAMTKLRSRIGGEAEAEPGPIEGKEVAMTEEEKQELQRLQADNLKLKAAAEKAEARAKITELAAQGIERERVIDQAVSEGRILPAMRDTMVKMSESFGSDIEGLKATFSELPVSARTTPVGVTSADDNSATAPELSSTERSVMTAFDISQEEWAKASNLSGFGQGSDGQWKGEA